MHLLPPRKSSLRPLGRRAFLRDGSLLLALACPTPLSRHVVACGLLEAAGKPDAPVAARIGLLTDLHYADKAPAGSRHYRESLTKVSEAKHAFHSQSIGCLIELGDLIDAADSVETELEYLRRIERELASISEQRHYVLGNHCVTTLSKPEFLREVGQEQAHASFVTGGTRCILLDACFRSDSVAYDRGNFQWTDTFIPETQLAWLERELAGSDEPVLVFVHQRLDVADAHGIKNAPQVRQILERSGKVQAVFQGHSHNNDYKEIGGIHYTTLVAMVEGSGPESSGYSVLNLRTDGLLELEGFRRQRNYSWPTRAAN
jgi:hypothetical protein